MSHAGYGRKVNHLDTDNDLEYYRRVNSNSSRRPGKSESNYTKHATLNLLLLTVTDSISRLILMYLPFRLDPGSSFSNALIQCVRV